MFSFRQPPGLFPGHCFHRAVEFQVESFHDRVPEDLAIPIPARLDSAVPKRKVEYLAGRLCAQRAMTMIGSTAMQTVGMGDKGAPIWPEGVVGSITHTHGFAAAVAAEARLVRSLGIDSEQVMSPQTMASVRKSVCLPGDAVLPEGELDATVETTLIFSAKESLFKCLFPLVGRMFWFHDASILVHPKGMGFFAVQLNTDLSDEFPKGYLLEGRFEIDPVYVHTGLMLEV